MQMHTNTYMKKHIHRLGWFYGYTLHLAVENLPNITQLQPYTLYCQTFTWYVSRNPMNTSSSIILLVSYSVAVFNRRSLDKTHLKGVRHIHPDSLIQYWDKSSAVEKLRYLSATVSSNQTYYQVDEKNVPENITEN